MVGYFKRKLGLAMGILFMIMALAGIVLPMAVAAAKERFPYRYCIVAYGVFILIGLFGAAFFKPVEESAKNNSDTVDGVHARLSVRGNVNREEIMFEESQSFSTEDQLSDKKKLSDAIFLIRWSLLKQWHFWLLIIGSAFGFTLVLNFYILMPLYTESIGLDLAQTAKLMSVTSGVDLFSRLFFSWIGDWTFIKAILQRPRKIIFALTGLCVGIVMAGKFFFFLFP